MQFGPSLRVVVGGTQVPGSYGVVLKGGSFEVGRGSVLGLRQQGVR